MVQEAKEAGKFQPEMFQPFDRLQIVTVQEILDGARMNLPLMEEVTKKAKKYVLAVQPGMYETIGSDVTLTHVKAEDTFAEDGKDTETPINPG